MSKRSAPEVNAGSMADIAFLLLVFFIVATTMEVDSGLMRRLPPYVPPEEQPDIPEIKERDVFVVLVNRNNQLMVEGRICQLEELKDKTIEFLLNTENREDLPQKKEETIPFFGPVMVPQGVISLQNDRGTDYGTFLQVQDALMAAANEVRNKFSNQRFGKDYDELGDNDIGKEQKNAVKKRIPIMISEAEPKNIQ